MKRTRCGRRALSGGRCGAAEWAGARGQGARAQVVAIELRAAPRLAPPHRPTRDPQSEDPAPERRTSASTAVTTACRCCWPRDPFLLLLLSYSSCRVRPSMLSPARDHHGRRSEGARIAGRRDHGAVREGSTPTAACRLRGSCKRLEAVERAASAPRLRAAQLHICDMGPAPDLPPTRRPHDGAQQASGECSARQCGLTSQ